MRYFLDNYKFSHAYMDPSERKLSIGNKPSAIAQARAAPSPTGMRSPGLATAGVGVPFPAIAHRRKSTTRASNRSGESFPSPTWAGKPLAPPLPRSGVSVPPSAPEEGRPVPRSRRSCVRDGGGGEVKGGTKGWIHFVGIGGCGLSALAMLALEQVTSVLQK